MKATNNIRRFQLCVILSMGMSYGLPAISQAGETCPTNSSGPDICVSFDGDTPQEGVHFTVDYMTDPANPSVTLKAGSLTWNVRSDDSGSPGNIGTISLDPTVPSADFEVTIANGTAAGAVDVGSIVLDDAGFTGHSNLGATTITGDVTGAITLVEDGENPPQGGEVTGPVVIGTPIDLSSVLGPITIPKVSASMTIWGDLAGAITVTEVSGSVAIYGDVQGVLTISQLTGTITISSDLAAGEIGTISAGAVLQLGGLYNPIGPHELDITGALAGTLRITGDLNNHGVIIDIADFEGNGRFEILGTPIYPTINLYNGIDSADASVFIPYHGGQIYLHDKDMLGVMEFPWFGEAGTVFDGGVLKGRITCGEFPTNPLNQGTIEFASVSAGGEIIAAVEGPFQGTIDIQGIMAGLIKIENDLSPGPGGRILIGGDLTGWVECNEDVKDSAVVTIGGGAGGALTGTGKITVDGVCDGDISVGKNTTSNTLIHCKSGLGATGSIVINASEGNFNAAGSITVGSNAFAPIAGDYDGCIHIQDEAGTGNGGNLDGQIRIAVCDDETSSDPGFDHIVCVDGDVNGTIEVLNGSCANQPGYDCPWPGCIP